MNWQKLYNPPVLWLLRSPLHRLADQQTIAITVTGRKSGKRYTFPVSYIRDGEKRSRIPHWLQPSCSGFCNRC